MIIEKELAKYIRQGNVNGYASARYPTFPDGDELIFVNEDFSNVDFLPFSIGFMVFKNCDLTGAQLRGQPVTIVDSHATHLDMRGLGAIIEAKNSDFRGMKFDDNTVLAKKENGSAGCSEFINCLFDPQTEAHFAKQGVRFKN